MPSIIARWSNWSETSLEHLAVTQRSDAIEIDSVVIGGAKEKFAARYRIICDAAWRVRRVSIDVIGNARELRLDADGDGHWFDATGAALAQLGGAIDVDMPMTPFTNTLPIRRLRLAPGQSADIRTVYITAPGLSLDLDPQRYTCLTPNRYRYESLDSDFSREIEVDASGLVMNYPGLFRRVL